MRNGICTKCGAQRVAHLEYVPDVGRYDGGRKLGTLSTPLAPSSERGPARNRGSLAEVVAFFVQIEEDDAESFELEVEAFVCSACGYFEEFVKNPELIPWERVEGLRWVHPETT